MLTKKTKIAVGFIKSLSGDVSKTFMVDASSAEVYQVAAKLVKADILGSNKGRNGGYYIKSNSVTLADVMKATGQVVDSNVFDDLALQGLYNVVLSQGQGNTEVNDAYAGAKTREERANTSDVVEVTNE